MGNFFSEAIQPDNASDAEDFIIQCIKKNDFEGLLDFYLDLKTNDDILWFRRLISQFYLHQPKYIDSKNKIGHTLKDYAVKNNCEGLIKLLDHYTATNTHTIINTTSIACLLKSSSAEQKQTTSVSNKISTDAVIDIKHAIYSLLSLESDLCDPKNRMHCIENGWAPAQYYPIHINLLTRLLVPANEAGEELNPYVNLMLKATINTLKIENITEIAVAILFTRKLLTAGEPVILDTGYQEPDSGHSIYVVFRANKTGYYAQVCNLGDGLEHHHPVHNTMNGFVPTIEYHFNSMNNLMRYFENCFICRNRSREEAFSVIYNQNLVINACENNSVVQYKQTTGNCVVKNLLLAHSQYFTDIGKSAQFDSIYQRLLKETINLYIALKGNINDLPTLENVCKAANNNELSFLSSNHCSWIQANLALPKQKKPLQISSTNRSYTSSALGLRYSLSGKENVETSHQWPESKTTGTTKSFYTR